MDNKKILSVIKKHLIEYCGNIIDSVVLFGSRAYGKPEKYSDYDILIILKIDYDWRLEHIIYDACYKLDLEYDILIDAKIISLSELGSIRGKQPYIQNALDMGISA